MKLLRKLLASKKLTAALIAAAVGAAGVYGVDPALVKPVLQWVLTLAGPAGP